MTLPILFLQVGHTFEEIARERGDYDVWFRAALASVDAEFRALRVFDGDPLPDDYAFGGIVVSGSWAMVTDREPWSERTADYLREASARDLPILGVCYGHQLLAQAFGGEVGFNPNGRNAGTARVHMTAAAAHDALFGALPRRELLMHVSHSQSVLRLPEGAVLLATTERDPNHAFRLGARVWGVQFHPEFDAEVARRYIELRRERIVSEGLDPEQLLASVQTSDDGLLLLRRFAQLVAEGT